MHAISPYKISGPTVVSFFGGRRGGHGSIPGYIYNATVQEHFRYIWESTGGDYFANPWVWVIDFKRVTQGRPAEGDRDDA
ncbi:hypothetical protein [Pseudomonas mucidolens]|uniref:Uncharacterized protein n=1 Tax=Pseudomonas mucidolens TaxID=46679 RepID=A0A1H2M3T6_9PSED|nr:hypothetical protein [Pseudomonas mucidolens]SDU87782.1 hypothetical protein SAMN05216202_0965 [Pseudomonas mucidolens]SQH34615.1 Uncharacterised protein [Pseudomonas mucidolens]